MMNEKNTMLLCWLTFGMKKKKLKRNWNEKQMPRKRKIGQK